MNLASAVLIALAFVLLLFVVAALVEARGAALERRPRLRHRFYILALGVYCSSWTFYGAVGTTVREGWNYLPIYLGPVLLLLLAPRFLTRLSEAVAEQGASTVSDFIAARFGHDAVVARLVTVIALCGTIPYIALQLRSIGNALSIASGQPVVLPAMIAAAALLALFATLFGARRYELAGRSEGLLYAIGVDSLVKLIALIAVAALAVVLLLGAPEERLADGLGLFKARFAPQNLTLEFAVISLISTMAIIVLPRQFYMGLVEARQSADLPRARFGLAAYIAAMALLIVPIALAGMTLLDPATPGDLYVLQLPAAHELHWLLAVAMLGGVGAAASMAIVDSTALATMVSNDLLALAVIRGGEEPAAGAIGRRMLLARRLSIVGIMALSLAWAMLVSPRESLASIGLVAFAAMAQFTPHLLLAAGGSGRDPLAARASLATGLAIWLYTLALPPILPLGWREALADTLLDPTRLFGIGRASPLVHGVAWSLGLNLAAFALVAARKMQRAPLPRLVGAPRRVSDLGELVQLVASFIGEERAASEFPGARRGVSVDRRTAHRAQQLIARVVGASSARTLVASALAGGQMNLHDVTRLLDQGGQSLRFSRQLLAATFENMDAGISVVDADMNLVAWNSRYEEILDYPPGMVRAGAPIADLIRHNARRGDFGPGDVEQAVQRRLGHLRRGLDHAFERRRDDGRVIKTVGGPMPGGGYVTSFTDITSEARMREELQHTLEQLESRVAERTHALSEANRRLAEADRDKTRFLAAASHDLLQPLHAARLFTAALERDVPERGQPLVRRVESAIIAAEDLLRALLDISKLDAGGVQPAPEALDLAPFLTGLAESVRPMAQEKGLRLKLGPLPGRVHTDGGLLRSIIQNFLTNAVRYSERGGVVIGVRRRADPAGGERLRIDVIDTGVGIEPERIEMVFGEFTRLGEVEAEGLGLGLALAERIARLLGGTIEVRSTPGRGSRFSLYLPAAPDAGEAAAALPIAPRTAATSGLSVLVVDNDPRIVEASLTLLERLGHRAIGAASLAQALPHSRQVDAVLADYQLDNGEDGLSLIAAMRAEMPGLPAMLITAADTKPLHQRAAALGVDVFAKPVSPRAIEAFLAAIGRGAAAQESSQPS